MNDFLPPRTSKAVAEFDRKNAERIFVAVQDRPKTLRGVATLIGQGVRYVRQLVEADPRFELAGEWVWPRVQRGPTDGA